MRTRRKIQHKLNARYSVSIGKKIGQILTVVVYILNYIDRLRTKRFVFFYFPFIQNNNSILENQRM